MRYRYLVDARNLRGIQNGFVDSASPEVFFIVAAVSQYLGAALAFSIFDNLGTSTVATLRVLGAALILILLRRSWRRSLKDLDMFWTASFGIVLAGMNLCFYLAIDNLPLGNAVAIEFLGPIAVAAAGHRSARNLVALIVASLGVLLLAQVTSEGTVTGVLFALAAGTLWGFYIVLGSKVARTGAHLDGLGIGMLIGGLAIFPSSLHTIGRAFDSPLLMLVALSTGVLGNVIPYGIDQLVFRRISKTRFAFLQSLLPATAACVGILVLRQKTSIGELLGIGLIIFAIGLRGKED
jgi:inner membrane transporter RhtA|tara:strand:- start:1046 stop:1927 length:882 start_codon:yes stop_codon:yes gene_type:complete